MQISKQQNAMPFKSVSFVEEQHNKYLKAFIRPNKSPSPNNIRTKLPTIDNLESPHSEQIRSKSMKNQMQEIKYRYGCIEKVLNQQNINLKMQTNYLTSEIRKSIRRQKMMREQMKKIRNEYEWASEKLQLASMESIQIRQYVEGKIMLLINSIKMPNLQEVVLQVKTIIKQLCQYFSINQPFRQEYQVQTKTKIVPKFFQLQNEIQIKIQNLNDKFQALMYQYKNTSKPQIRKQCIEIAKEIKKLKSNSKIKKQIIPDNLIKSENNNVSITKNIRNIYQSDEENINITQQKRRWKHPQQTQRVSLRRKTSESKPKSRPCSSFSHLQK